MIGISQLETKAAAFVVKLRTTRPALFADATTTYCVINTLLETAFLAGAAAGIDASRLEVEGLKP